MTGEPRELLWITPKWPFPAEDGARVATGRLLQGLSRRGHQIDLLAICGPDEKINPAQAQSELGVRKVFQVPRPANPEGRAASAVQWLGALATQPWLAITLRHYATARVHRAIDQVVNAPGIADRFGIVYDGLHPASHQSRFGQFQASVHGPRVFYRAHNFETDIWRRKAEQTSQLPLRLFLEFQAARMRAFETSLALQCAGLAPVSAEDLAAFRSFCPQTRARVVPIGSDFSQPPPLLEESGFLDVVFIGKLDWPPNREGLLWFLDKVWPRAFAARPTLRLSIVGSGAAGPLGTRSSLRGVRFLGRVENLDEIYRQSAISLAPVFYGSGTRVKVIEASRYGRACLSTAIGVEGTGLLPGQSYLRAETEAEWIQALVKTDVTAARELGRRAWQQMKDRFDLNQAAGEFERLMDECA